jgi:hypothetical protein
MRPIRRGPSPRLNDFIDYADAKPELVSRLGPYCSFCERRVPTNLAVEHVQPKGLPAYAQLIGRWDNFLLSCVNCNATKKDKDVRLAQVLLPDRDNTFAALIYQPDGTIAPSPTARAAGLAQMVVETLALTGLDKAAADTPDQNGKQVALDRMRQRMETWLEAIYAKSAIDAHPTNQVIRHMAARLASASGFFSIWMAVFDDDADMRRRLIDTFPGTGESGCFGMTDARPVSPAPNPDALAGGGKI